MIRKSITGIVKKNLGRGTRLGFPTANIHIAEENLDEGIYAALTDYQATKYPSLAFIGAAETFGEEDKKLEVYVLDFNRDLYGQKITVQLVEKLRGAKKFASEEELIIQMKIDEQQARGFFKTYGRIE